MVQRVAREEIDKNYDVALSTFESKPADLGEWLPRILHLNGVSA